MRTPSHWKRERCSRPMTSATRAVATHIMARKTLDLPTPNFLIAMAHREGKAGAEDSETEDRFQDFPGDESRVEILDASRQEERQEVHGSDQELVHHDDLRLVAVGEKFCQGGVADL